MVYLRCMKNKKILLKLMIFLLLITMFVSYILASSGLVYKKISYQNRYKFINAEKLLVIQDFKYDRHVFDVKEIIKSRHNFNVLFNAKMTSYGPDCDGCSGRLACNGMNVFNGNIYYHDAKYGKLRIIASDSRIPCGTIFKVSGFNNEEFYAINLDRGGLIKSLKFDLLTESEIVSARNGIKDVKMNLIRWGYNG